MRHVPLALAVLLMAATSRPALAADPVVADPATLDAEEIELKVLIGERRDEMVRTLAAWVDINTGSWNGPGLDAFARLLAKPLEALGFQVEILPGDEVDLPGRGRVATGPIVRARRKASPPDKQGMGNPLRVLLVGHFDTVFEPDSPFQRFAVDPDDSDRATGPGVADMKSGLVVLLEALRGLHSLGDLDDAEWTVLFNSDEEIGSLGSRGVIEAEARRADVGFVFESAHDGGMVRSRRGLGQFHLSVEGVAAHAGSAHDQGRSAIHEIAAKILRIEALTDYDRGLTLNVGTVRGGTKRNIVPEHAEAWIDVRYDAPELGREVREALEAVAREDVVDGTRTTLWGQLHRPPKQPTPQVDALLERHERVAAALGIRLPDPRHAGGGTDGSLMGAVGLTTLDSMGAVGGGAHTSREHLDLSSMPSRAVLAAVLLRRLARERLYGPGSGR
ncbi:MAG: M20 family metallopeptidase [Deltaproteobacteria bacterium]|nr:M20 family metallopeptidase [Deltaproteobacteria bacterium]